jgi:hypothetical protein
VAGNYYPVNSIIYIQVSSLFREWQETITQETVESIYRLVLCLDEPVAKNYYPVNSRIYIQVSSLLRQWQETITQ